MQIYISNLALEDIEEIYKYISQDSIFYAQRTIRKLYEAFDLIKQFPHIGKQVLRAKNENIKEFIHKKYKIVYQINKEEIIIQYIMHNSRNAIYK